MENLLNESRKKSSAGAFSASGTSTSVGVVGTVFFLTFIPFPSDGISAEFLPNDLCQRGQAVLFL
jgi:hypothetical protein